MSMQSSTGKPKKVRIGWIVVGVIVVAIIGSVLGGKDEAQTEKVGEASTSSAAVEANASVSEEKSEVSSTVSAAEEKSKSESQKEETQTLYRVGDILKDGDLDIVFVSSGDYTEDNEFMTPPEGKKYIFAEFAFKNNSTSDKTVSYFDFECYADGYSAESYYGGEDTLSATISAGRQTTGKIYFEVPTDASDIEIEYSANYLTDRKIKFVYEGNKTSDYQQEVNSEASADSIKVGESTESKELKITYVSCINDPGEDFIMKADDGFHIVTCEFEFENLSNSDQYISTMSFDCYADGTACDDISYRDDSLSATLSAGRKTKGTVSFEVPDGAKTVEVEYLSDFWTSSRVVFAADVQ